MKKVTSFEKSTKKSLKTTMIFRISVMIIIVCLGLAAIAYTSAYSALKSNIDESMQKIVVQASRTVSERSEIFKKSLSSLASNQIFENMAVNKDAIISLLKEQTEANGHLTMFAADKDGQTYANLDMGNVADQDYFKEAMKGQQVISDPVINDGDKTMRIFIAVPVVNSSGQMVGALVAVRDGREISEMISDVTYAKSGKAFMLNKKGVTIAHSNQDLVISKDNDFENIKSDDKLAQLVALETKMVAGETGVGQYDYNGIVKYMAYCPVDGTNWFIALTAPQTEVFESVTELAYYILIAGVLFIALSVLVANYLATSIIMPIKRTVQFAMQLAQGETDAHIEIKSNNEVGQLADTLNKDVREAFIKINKAREIAIKQNDYRDEHAKRLVVNLERLAKGELYCDMEVEMGDQDVAELCNLFNSFKESLFTTTHTIKAYIEDIAEMLAKISDGDLTVKIESQYKGDFIALKDSINGIVSTFRETMTEIDSAAKQVSAGTAQVSSGSQTISQGATEQASSIEELSASITQIAAQTKQNAVNANKANELAMSAQTEATDGNDHMEEMQAAMSQINESSQNISKIIKVIDDIAFQTNILALNAAVEAARAGIHGKGFAVVAEEVRNLAARSASAAKETTELIEGSIKKVEAGTRIADQTAAALSNIVSSVGKAAELVAQIASASNEQATGITQVDRGIEQLSQVVQTNSATAQEAAAASEELSSQADLLKSMVGQFTLQEAEVKRSEAAPALKQRNSAMEISLSDNDYGKY